MVADRRPAAALHTRAVGCAQGAAAGHRSRGTGHGTACPRGLRAGVISNFAMDIPAGFAPGKSHRHPGAILIEKGGSGAWSGTAQATADRSTWADARGLPHLRHRTRRGRITAREPSRTLQTYAVRSNSHM